MAAGVSIALTRCPPGAQQVRLKPPAGASTCAACATPCAVLRPAPQRAAPRSARRAGADGALAEHQRPQPRHRLHAAAGAGSPIGRSVARRAGRGGRGGDPARADLEGEVTPDQGDAGARSGRDTGGLDLSLLATAPRERRSTCSSPCPASGARRPPACCSSPSTGPSCRSTPTSTGSARGSELIRPEGLRSWRHTTCMRSAVPPGRSTSCTSTCIRHGRRLCTARARPAPSARCAACAPTARPACARPKMTAAARADDPRAGPGARLEDRGRW